MKEVIIYKFQLEAILESLRLTSRIHNCKNGETCFDRTVRDAYLYAENALNGKPETIVTFGKNQAS